MTYRATNHDLYNVLESINRLAIGQECPEYSTIGAFDLDFAYGGVRLVRFTNENGGQTNITPRDTKANTFNMMHAFLAGMYHNQNWNKENEKQV